MATISYEGDAAATLRAWAKAYRDGPAQYRFPSDPHAEFFPRDMEIAAVEIERLQRCHRIIAKQVGFYKPDLPDITEINIYLGVLRAAERCEGPAPSDDQNDAAP